IVRVLGESSTTMTRTRSCMRLGYRLARAIPNWTFGPPPPYLQSTFVPAPSDLHRISAEIVKCRRCPRLVEWRERVATEERAAFRQPTHTAGTGQLRAVPGPGGLGAGPIARSRVSRLLRVGRSPSGCGPGRTSRPAAEAEVRAPRRGRGRTLSTAGVFPSEPAEHVHREAPPRDDGGRVPEGDGVGGPPHGVSPAVR